MAVVHFAPQKIYAVLQYDFGATRKVNLNCFLEKGKQVTLLLNAVARFAGGKRPYTQRQTFETFKILGEYLTNQNKSIPESLEAWQRFIPALYEYHFSRDDRKANFKSRQLAWNALALICEYLRDHALLIPIGVEIPRLPGRVLLSGHGQSALPGDANLEPVESVFKDDLLGIPLHLPDESYLDFVRDGLMEKRRTIHDCLMAWWKQLKAHESYGEFLLKDVNWPVLSKYLKKQNYRYSGGPGAGSGHGNYHLANGRTEETMRNLLAILRFEFDSRCTKPIFESAKHLPTRIILRVPPECPTTVSAKVTCTQRINWMLGHLSPIDIAALTALLIMHNPCFTPMSLMNAKAYRKNHKIIFELGANGQEFTIEKPRSQAMKKSQLDDLSVEILSFVYRVTDPHRKRLQKQGSPVANLLFLNSNKSYEKPPAIEGVVGYLSGAVNLKHKLTGNIATHSRGISLLDHFPVLEQAGITKGTLTFTRLRTAEGVLEWFRTGSSTAMSKILGNTPRVSINHYLPRVLLDLWNTRMIRRFQNLWIVIASPSEEIMLASTDFQTADDLHKFIQDMLVQHPENSSPLAEELHNGMAARITSPRVTEMIGGGLDGSLSISISRKSLAALYHYHDCAYKAGIPFSKLKLIDSATGISPQALLDLSELLRHQLPLARETAARTAHLEAEEDAVGLSAKTNWTELMIRKVGSVNDAI